MFGSPSKGSDPTITSEYHEGHDSCETGDAAYEAKAGRTCNDEVELTAISNNQLGANVDQEYMPCDDGKNVGPDHDGDKPEHDIDYDVVRSFNEAVSFIQTEENGEDVGGKVYSGGDELDYNYL